MQIVGLQKTTLVDYPGKVACTAFTPGCNFRCPYCHNPELINPTHAYQVIPESEFLDWLSSRKGWLDGVCVTGGEPTLQKDLPEFARKVKDLGFLFKLDTNGSNPGMLGEMLDAKLVDFVAMDIKAPLEDYSAATKVAVVQEDIQKSIDLIRTKAPDYEFRTTVGPAWYSKEAALKIGKWLEGSKAYYLQQYVPGNTLDPNLSQQTFTKAELEELAGVLKPYFKRVDIRGI
jgi:pyruvate formate lyase activating enzyme